MSEINEGLFPQHLLQAMQTMAGEEYKALPEQTAGLFDVRSSSRASELGVMMTGAGLATTKNEGGRIGMDSISEHFTKRFVHKVYAKYFAVTMEMIADDQQATKVVELVARELAKRLMQTKDIVRTNILNNAFSSSYVGGDAVALLSASHPLGSGGVFSNLMTAADLSEASLEAGLIAVMSLPDNNGIITPVAAEKLIIPVGEVFNAKRLLASVGRVGTADNDINAIKAMGAIDADPMVNRYLSDVDAWFIKTDVSNGLIAYEHTGVTVERDNDFLTKNMLISGHERHSSGWIDPRALLGSQGA